MAEATKTRVPKCARCRNHGFTVNLRGHKSFCPHKSCTCELCDLVKERQEVSKRQIKLRRHQQQQETMGMYVPVPPSIFTQGSVCGINLDYLRVVFPRIRVDRLYAVLLQCNNDVNATIARLQQDGVTKNNKATQWSPDSIQTKTITSSDEITAQLRNEDRHMFPTNPNREADDCVQMAPAHCLFPYCWSHAVPAQFTPGDTIPPQTHDFFRALSSRPQGKTGTFGADPFPLGCSMPADSLGGMLSAGPAKAVEASRECSTSKPAVITQEAATSPTLQSGMWCVSDIDMSMAEPAISANMSIAEPAILANMPLMNVLHTSKVAGQSEPIYTSASTWPDVPATAPLPRITLPFGLPAPSHPSLPHSWPSHTLPPLPYLASAMPHFFHQAACDQNLITVQSSMPGPQSSTQSLERVAMVSNHKETENNSLNSHEVLGVDITYLQRPEEKTEDSAGIIEDGIEVCMNVGDELIDPTGF